MRPVLAPVSPVRRTTFIAADITPAIQVSIVDEDAVLVALPGRRAFLECTTTPADEVAALVAAKYADVCKALNMSGTNVELPEDETVLVIDCNSMLEIDGQMLGESYAPDATRERIRATRRTSATLWTGHSAAVLVPASSDNDQRHERTITATVTRSASTQAHFGDISGAEIDAYVATGESPRVVGLFTVDGPGGSFIEGVTGDYHLVVGISLPLLCPMATEFGVFWSNLRDVPRP